VDLHSQGIILGTNELADVLTVTNRLLLQKTEAASRMIPHSPARRAEKSFTERGNSRKGLDAFEEVLQATRALGTHVGPRIDMRKQLRSQFDQFMFPRRAQAQQAVTGRLFAGILFLFALQSCGGGSSQSSKSSPLSVATASLAGGTVTVMYSATLAATGGTGSGYTWIVSGGSLPTGLTLSASGALSGTPTAVGSFNFTVQVSDSSGTSATAPLSLTIVAAGPLTDYEFTGDTSPVHDPSIFRQGVTYYVFSTDASSSQGGFLPIRCSTDLIAWSACGFVFSSMPSWISAAAPQATELWAPDISFFNGTYHLYYAASSFGSNVSVIGLATNTTLDSSDANYAWVDQGPILQSVSADDFNAIDPNILVDNSANIWLSYGSFWNGIYQQQIDPATGLIQAGSATHHLAERASNVANDPIEGASLVYANGYYYLFVSWDYCCESNPAQSDYKIVVGRGTSPNGPFTDMNGVDLAAGGGTVLLQGDSTWAGPGGQTAYIDATNGDLIVFHALALSQNGLDYLFVRSLTWANGWPVIGTSTTAVSADGSRARRSAKD
jgi:arabinan endo-1,5-alpha-L-arabinosidase